MFGLAAIAQGHLLDGEPVGVEHHAVTTLALQVISGRTVDALTPHIHMDVQVQVGGYGFIGAGETVGIHGIMGGTAMSICHVANRIGLDAGGKGHTGAEYGNETEDVVHVVRCQM